MKDICDIDDKSTYWTDLKDMFGAKIQLGDVLARGVKSSSSAFIELVRVTRIVKEKIYVDNNQNPIQYPGRCINMNADFREMI